MPQNTCKCISTNNFKRCFTVTIILPFAIRFSYVFSEVQFFSVSFQDMFCAFHDFILKTVWNRVTWVITQKHLQQIDPNNTKIKSDIIVEICIQINLSIEWIFQNIHVKMMKNTSESCYIGVKEAWCLLALIVNYLKSKRSKVMCMQKNFYLIYTNKEIINKDHLTHSNGDFLIIQSSRISRIFYRKKC